MSGPRIEARGIGYRRGSRAVLDGVDLEVGRGELLCLVGPNGAGKSTLLHLLAGDLLPHSGDIVLDGRPLRGYRPGELARIRSVLTQSNEVSFAFTVDDVVQMGRAPWRGTAREDDPTLLARALADAEIEHLAERRMPELSGGERARVAYARVRAQDCEIVLLDEPTASLDIRHQERLLRQLRAHTASGGSAVVVLHDLDLAAAYADRVAVLADGRLRGVGHPRDILTAGLLSEVYRHPIDVHTIGLANEQVIRPVRVGSEERALPHA